MTNCSRWLIGVLSLAVLAGCAGSGARSDDERALLALDLERLACPPARLLEDTVHLTARTPAQDGHDAGAASNGGVYEADLVAASTTCRQDRGHWSVSVHIKATAGAVGRVPDGEVHLPLFVALTEFDRRVLDKKILQIPVTFDPRVRRVVLDRTIEGLSAPLAELHPGPGYEVLVGFQLTPEQVERNRRRRLD